MSIRWEQIHEVCPTCGPEAPKGKRTSPLTGVVAEWCFRCNLLLGMQRDDNLDTSPEGYKKRIDSYQKIQQIKKEDRLYYFWGAVLVVIILALQNCS